MEDDGATREGIQKRPVVGYITVGKLEITIGGGRREGGEIAGATDQGADRVAFFQKSATESPT